MEQIGIVIPGQTNDLNNAIDPLLGDEYSTLGETPNQTTLTITYRVGGGINTNVPSSDITTVDTNLAPQNGDSNARLTTVTNNFAARGGKDAEDTGEIREKTKAFFSTQNRCVTKEDYEARVMNVPGKYGNIAKVYVARSGDGDAPAGLNEFNTALGGISSAEYELTVQANAINNVLNGEGSYIDQINAISSMMVLVNTKLDSLRTNVTNLQNYDDLTVFNLSSITIHVLAYNNKKELVGNPNALNLGTTDNLPITLLGNISKYLSNFRLLTDTISINDGYVVNFGVFFDLIAEKYANKQQVKLNCIQKIKDYFRIEKMQFNQPIYKSNLEFELMGVEGVRSIGHVTLTQDYDYFYEDAAGNDTGGDTLTEATYTYSYDNNGDFEDSSGPTGGGSVGYGYKYDFKLALSTDGTIVLPPNTSTPTVFELKKSNTNIQGRVR